MISEVLPALVVGAGPAGLTAALALRALRVPVTLVEAQPQDRVRPGSRALFVHRDSLELLERASSGLGGRLAGHGVVWHTRRTLYRGREVHRRSFPVPSAVGLPPFTSLRQVETERHLLEACKAAEVELVWDAPVAGVAGADRGVTVTLADGRRIEAEYVVAADGARSAVRSALGIALEGPRSSAFHVVVDVEEVGCGGLPVERVLHFGDPSVAGRTLLRVPFAGGFQLDLQCRDDDDPDRLATPEGLRGWLPAVVGERYLDRVLWASRYRFLQVVASCMVDPHRRVLLVGEAAHLFPPFGARGMNSGIADADAAATAVALALAAGHRSRAVAAVEQFARQRRAAAVYNRDAAGTALRHLRPTAPSTRLRQQVAARLAPLVPRWGAWLDEAAYGPVAPPPGVPTGRY